MEPSSQIEVYERVLDQIGRNGKFQKCYQYVVNFGITATSTMAIFNYFLYLAIPDHWCHVDGQESYTVEEWKSMTIPNRTNEENITVFEKCLMYPTDSKNSTSCLFGWDYDRTWFNSTIPSQENWICKDDIKVANSFMYLKLGELLGTITIGQIGDRFGRRPAIYISLITLLIGKTMIPFTTHTFPLFALASMIGTLCVSPIFQAPLVVSMEISSPDDRSFVYLLQAVGWTVGLSVLSLTYWYLRNWLPFLIATTVPILPYLFMTKLMIESPRWLLNKGRIQESLKVLQRIAKMNGKEVPGHIFHPVTSKTKAETESLLTLLKPSLLKYTVLATIGWGTFSIMDAIIYQNLTNFSGNPFKNFLLQSFSEVPGFLLGKVASDHLGRKPTRVFAYLLSLIPSGMIIFFVNTGSSYETLISCSSISLKFVSSIIAFVGNLHVVEIFPTNLRQSGVAAVQFLGGTTALAAPYIVYLGTAYDARYPYYATAAFGIVGALSSSFLPETRNRRLPETVEDVAKLGRNVNAVGDVQIETKL